jgi:hypothetical protein
MEEAAMVLPASIESTLARAVEAAGPDDEAAGPAMDTAMAAVANDAGAPPALAIPESHIASAVLALQKHRALSQNGIVALVRKTAAREAERAYRLGYRDGAHRGWQHGERHAEKRVMLRGEPRIEGPGDFEVRWNRSRQMRDFRGDVISRYSRIHGGKIKSGIGFYYGTIQVKMDCVGTVTDAAFSLTIPDGNENPVIDQCFNLAIGDTEEQWFGGPHVLNPADTNLQNPGQNLYPDEVFIIEALSSCLKGVRIAYPESRISGFGGLDPAIQACLLGATPIWDRAGVILPGELFNQFSDVFELAQAVAEVSTLYFNWADKGVGGNNIVNTKLIERFSAVPGGARRRVQETAGGALTLDLPRGFLWLLDKMFQANQDSGGNGLFNAQLNLLDSVLFPFAPIAVPGSGGAPVVPTAIAMEWQIMLHGTSLLPWDSDGTPVPRRRL